MGLSLSQKKSFFLKLELNCFTFKLNIKYYSVIPRKSCSCLLFIDSNTFSVPTTHPESLTINPKTSYLIKAVLRVDLDPHLIITYVLFIRYYIKKLLSMKHEDVKNLSVSDQSTQSTNHSSLVQSINKDSGRLILFYFQFLSHI